MSRTTEQTTGFDIDPWQLHWRGVDLEKLGRNETLFALSNGCLLYTSDAADE